MEKFYRKDLKTGMILELPDGDLAMVLLGTANGDIASGQTWFPLSSVGDCLNDQKYTAKVAKVYQPRANMDYLFKGVSLRNADLIWEYEKRSVVTVGDKKYYEDELAEALSKIKPVEIRENK